MRRILWILVPALLVCVASGATVTLQADSHVYMNNEPAGSVGVPFDDLVGVTSVPDENVLSDGFSAMINAAELDTGNYTQELRAYVMFPSAGLPAGYTITGAKIGVYPNEEAVDGFGMSFTVVSFSPGESITGADYGAIGTTHLITDIPVEGSLTTGQYTNLSFNAAGIAGISNTEANGYAIILVPTEPEWSSAGQEILPIDASISKETPIFLEIEYTAPEVTPAPTTSTSCGTWDHVGTGSSETIMSLLGVGMVFGGLGALIYGLKGGKKNPALILFGLASFAAGCLVVLMVFAILPFVGSTIEGMC